jgi:hypothetical protein
VSRSTTAAVVAIGLGALLLATLAGATTASGTTDPSVVVRVRVTVTDTKVTLSRPSARRGWGGIFTILNKGKKAHRVEFGLFLTPVIRPGKGLTLRYYFEYRGPQPIEVRLNRGGPNHRAVFRVV